MSMAPLPSTSYILKAHLSFSCGEPCEGGDQSEWAPWSRDLVSTNHSSPPRWRAAPAGTPRSRWCRCRRCRRCGRRGHCGTGQRELMMTISLNLEHKISKFCLSLFKNKSDGLRHPDPCSWTAPRCPWGRPAGTWTRTSPWWAGRWGTRLGTRSTSPGRETPVSTALDKYSLDTRYLDRGLVKLCVSEQELFCFCGEISFRCFVTHSAVYIPINFAFIQYLHDLVAGNSWNMFLDLYLFIYFIEGLTILSTQLDILWIVSNWLQAENMLNVTPERSEVEVGINQSF